MKLVILFTLVLSVNAFATDPEDNCRYNKLLEQSDLQTSAECFETLSKGRLDAGHIGGVTFLNKRIVKQLVANSTDKELKLRFSQFEDNLKNAGSMYKAAAYSNFMLIEFLNRQETVIRKNY